jgi:hypothetical protein
MQDDERHPESIASNKRAAGRPAGSGDDGDEKI